MTVSNLSQAIRFLVDNDFLENVELRPGEASEKMIEVIDESSSMPNAGGKESVSSIAISTSDNDISMQ
jgi:hypothetical protein